MPEKINIGIICMVSIMKVNILGCGRWGTFIAWYLDRIGHQVTIYGRASSKNMTELMRTRRNDVILLPDSIRLTDDLSEVCDAELIIISIGSQQLRGLMEELSCYDLKDKVICLCMKGLEQDTGKRLTQIVEEYVHESCKIAVWLGPGHVQEFYDGIPNLMVIDSIDHDTKRMLIDNLSSELIRFYYGEDLIGNEIGAAAKNVVGIAAGALDGLNISSMKGALMSRGAREVSRLIAAMGGKELTAYGLCHLGDYEATVFSKYSHNRMFGEKLVRGESYDKLAEGCYTVKAIMLLAEKYGVDMPVCKAVYDCIYNGHDPMTAIKKMFDRSLKAEFD